MNNQSPSTIDAQLSKIFEGVKPLMDKYNDSNPLVCDADCQADKTKDKYYNAYMVAKKNLEEAPKKLTEAEENFYMLGQTEKSYTTMKSNQASKEINNISNIITANFDNKVNELQARLDDFNAQSIYAKHIQDLTNSYGRDINQLSSSIGQYKSKVNINNRLAYYYSKQIKARRSLLFFLRILYWFLLTIYVCYYLLYHRMILNKKRGAIGILLIIVPLIIKPIVTWIYPPKIIIPSRDAACLTKPSKTVINPSSTPTPPAPPPWTPPPEPPSSGCPAPTLWAAIENALPRIGHGPEVAKQNVKNKFENLKDDIMRPIRRLQRKL